MNSLKTEPHPFNPFLPANARIFMLGSFPPAKNRWSMDFYYPNIQNDMWRIVGLIFKKDKNYFVSADKKHFDKERIVSFLNETGIALGDTAQSVVRHKENASDKFLEIIEPANINAQLSKLPECKAVVTTGQKATETFCSIINVSEPKVGQYAQFSFMGRDLKFYRMPSSSRAYPKPIEEKARMYEQMFREIGMI